jgi:pSer/pThr/pTyr-binding forkhead associated (FHA) protein
MPLTLILRSTSAPPGTPAPALTFDGPRVVIGRGASCDVRLPDPSVSHRHATVRTAGSDWVVVDEGSTNGTFVGEAKLAPKAPRPLKSGDMVRVGRVWLEARVDQTPPTRDLAFATRDLALALVSQAMRALGEDASTKLRVIEGRDAGASLVIADEGRAYTIGRDATCDLPLADVDTSRTHATVVKRGAAVLVRDAGSKNGAFLGEARLALDRDAPWRPGSLLRVGVTTIALDEPAADALAELEAADDEPMAPGDVPAVPESGAMLPTSPSDPPGPPLVALTPQNEPRPSRPPKRAAWSATDVAVMLAALTVMVLSLAGLWWLLRS